MYSFSVAYLNTKPVSTIGVAEMEEHGVRKDTRWCWAGWSWDELE